MKYQTFPPPKELANFVRFFWVLECEVTSGEVYTHRTMASGCPELLFHYEGTFDHLLVEDKIEASFLSGIHGQSRVHQRFQIDRNFGIFGAYLYPYALPVIFRLPACEVSDQMPDLLQLLGRDGRDLEEKMMLASNNDERVQIISHELISRLQHHSLEVHPIQSAIRTMIHSHGQSNILALSEKQSLSRRQFERVFKKYAGFSPKLYARILRFQSVFNEIGGQHKNLTRVAYQCGYADQSHFIHDFKEFSGFKPGEFLNEQSSEGMIWSP